MMEVRIKVMFSGEKKDVIIFTMCFCIYWIYILIHLIVFFIILLDYFVMYDNYLV